MNRLIVSGILAFLLAIAGNFEIRPWELPEIRAATSEPLPAILATNTPGLPAKPASDNAPLMGVVNVQSLNVRECASKSCRAVDWLFAGNQVEIIAGKDGWLKIGEGQWVYGSYIDIKETHFDRRH